MVVQFYACASEGFSFIQEKIFKSIIRVTRTILICMKGLKPYNLRAIIICCSTLRAVLLAVHGYFQTTSQFIRQVINSYSTKAKSLPHLRLYGSGPAAGGWRYSRFRQIKSYK
jgi:hypothetical protein